MRAMHLHPGSHVTSSQPHFQKHICMENMLFGSTPRLFASVPYLRSTLSETQAPEDDCILCHSITLFYFFLSFCLFSQIVACQVGLLTANLTSSSHLILEVSLSAWLVPAPNTHKSPAAAYSLLSHTSVQCCPFLYPFATDKMSALDTDSYCNCSLNAF